MEKERRATELFIANTKLTFQYKQKEKRAYELMIANAELAYQNHERKKRADELLIANAELAFQNMEKKKRAAELIIANKELALQNEEKEKRATELIMANIGLKKAKEIIRKFNRKLKRQNTKLIEIGQLQSHQVRVPIAHILGLFNLFNFKNPPEKINGEILIQLKTVAESLDDIIHEIVVKTNEIERTIEESKEFF